MKHLAIIADGNRRWAAEFGLPVEAGYIQGLTAIENCCAWAIRAGVPHLSVYCFSTENWNRPKEQVSFLMDLAKGYFDERREWYWAMGIRVRFRGRRDRFDREFLDRMERLETGTEKGSRLTLYICVDYGGRDEIVRAVSDGARTEEEISRVLERDFPSPDAIVRTGGERRLSNFLLWQCAYAELFFRDEYFPDISEDILDEVQDAFKGRKRNYGM